MWAIGCPAADCTDVSRQPGVMGDKHRVIEKGQVRPTVPLSSDVTVRTIGAAIKASPNAKAICTIAPALVRRIMALGDQGQKLAGLLGQRVGRLCGQVDGDRAQPCRTAQPRRTNGVLKQRTLLQK